MRLDGSIASSIRFTSVVSTNENRSPYPSQIIFAIRYVPPYTFCDMITWSPGASRWKIASTAAVPDPNASPSVPPSRAAIFCSSAVRVGLETREYS